MMIEINVFWEEKNTFVRIQAGKRQSDPFDTSAHSWMVELKILTLENKVDAWQRLHQVLDRTDATNVRKKITDV